jgi:CheY-like chemotaxis protein
VIAGSDLCHANRGTIGISSNDVERTGAHHVNQLATVALVEQHFTNDQRLETGLGIRMRAWCQLDDIGCDWQHAIIVGGNHHDAPFVSQTLMKIPMVGFCAAVEYCQYVERILVVDDEPGIVDVLTFALEEAGFETIVAIDGPTALRIALTESPSLILLDVMLPGLDGLTVCREIRMVSDVPIILLTAKGSEADRVAGLELHADDYVVKPFSVRELVARVRRTSVAQLLPHHPPQLPQTRPRPSLACGRTVFVSVNS